MYRLKKGIEAFTVVEGPFAGRSFAPGSSYDEIPTGMAGRFIQIKEAIAPAGEPEKAEPGDAGKKGRKL